jgi:ABC-2 type transport system permease protein
VSTTSPVMAGSSGGDGSPGRTLGAGAPAHRASWLRMALALSLYEFRLVLRRGEGLLITFVIPAGVLLVFSTFDMGGGTSARPAVDRMLPGSISLAIIAAALVSLAISTAFERQYGVIKRLGGSPAGSSVVVASKTVSVIVVEIAQLVLLVGIAVALLGWVAGPDVSWPLTFTGVVLGTVAFAGLGLLMAGTLRAEATLALANLLFLLSLVLGGIVVPLDRLPGFVATVAEGLPAAALTQTLTIGLGYQAGDATEPVLLLAGWAVVLAVLAARQFRWD